MELAAPRCTATTIGGSRCRKGVLPGLEVCATHGGRPGRPGRPTILNDELASRIVAVLRAGGHVETAATVAGVARARISEWMRRGDPAGNEPRDAPFRRFRERVEQARAECEARNVALITQAATQNWQAAAWLLERSYPERWARPSQRGDLAPTAEPAAPADAFSEVDDLASRRRNRA